MLAHGNEFADFNSCHTNFIHGFNRVPAVQAIEDEEERRAKVRFLADHNDINIFQPNEIKPDEDGVSRGFMYPAPPVPDGTGIERYLEKDAYVVISNCPYADQALPLLEAKPNPMYILVYETGIAPETDDPLGLVKGPEWEEMIYAQFRDGTKDASPRYPEDFGTP